MAMSWVAAAKAMASARAPITHGASGRPRRPPAGASSANSATCVRTIQPRRRPSQRRRVAVHQRRPEELERPRRLRQRDQADDADVDARLAHPVGDGDPHQPQRHAGRRTTAAPPRRAASSGTSKSRSLRLPAAGDRATWVAEDSTARSVPTSAGLDGGREAKAPHLVVEPLSRDPQVGRCSRPVSLAPAQCGRDLVALEGDANVEEGVSRSRRRAAHHGCGEVAAAWRPSARPDQEPAHLALELPDVARPAMGPKRTRHFGGQAWHRDPVPLGRGFQEVAGEEQDVVPPIAQRRDVHVEHIEPVERFSGNGRPQRDRQAERWPRSGRARSPAAGAFLRAASTPSPGGSAGVLAWPFGSGPRLRR